MDIKKLHESVANPNANQYLTPGRTVQVIGSQNGGFHPFGHHIPGEMGGIWMYPIKLFSGFWMDYRIGAGEWTSLPPAVKFTNYAFYNEFEYRTPFFTLRRTQFNAQNEAMAITTFKITNTNQHRLPVHLRFFIASDLRPSWSPIEENNLLPKTQDTFHELNSAGVVFQTAGFSWTAGARLTGDWPLNGMSEAFQQSHTLPDFVQAKEAGYCWETGGEIGTQQSISFNLYMTGDTSSPLVVADALAHPASITELFNEKQKYYQVILDTADVKLPDKQLETQFAWSKCHVEWLTITSPSVGTGLVAGAPEYMWWFGVDSAYAIKGTIPAGFSQLAKDTLAIVAQSSRKENPEGRIIHEVNSFGIVGNRGNTQETAIFIHTLYVVYQWTGDRAWLRPYLEQIQNGLQWLLTEKDQDHDLFPEGYGIIEMLGLNGELIDTAVYTQVALSEAAEMLAAFDDISTSRKYAQLADRLKAAINEQFWLDQEDLYGDIRISGKRLYERIANFTHQVSDDGNPDLLAYYEQLGERLKVSGAAADSAERTWNLKNWVINTPIEMGIALPAQAERALKVLNSSEYCGKYGMYLSGIEKTRIMTISSAVQINANLRYHHPDAAWEIMQRVMSTFNAYLPGSISEMSPDYGCFVQAWTAYAMISPVITGFIGLHPNAAAKTIELDPQLPKDWNWVNIVNVPVGKLHLTISITRTSKGITAVVSGVPEDWKLIAGQGASVIRNEVETIDN